MSEKVKKDKTTIYFTPKNKNNLKIASFLGGESYTKIVNNLIEENLEDLVKKLQEKSNVQIVEKKEKNEDG